MPVNYTIRLLADYDFTDVFNDRTQPLDGTFNAPLSDLASIRARSWRACIPPVHSNGVFYGLVPGYSATSPTCLCSNSAVYQYIVHYSRFGCIWLV